MSGHKKAAYGWLGWAFASFLMLGPGTAYATTFNSSAVSPSFPMASTNFLFPDEPKEWLLIGTGAGGFGTTVSVNSGFELGAHLPLDEMIPTHGGGQGPDLSSVTMPTGATPPMIGVGRNGDIALTSVSGKFNLQTIDGDGRLGATFGRSGFYGDTGVQCSQGTGGCTDGNSNTYFDNMGNFPMPPTLLSNSNGINAGNASTHAALRAALDDVNTHMPLMPSGGNLPSGTFSSDLTITSLKRRSEPSAPS